MNEKILVAPSILSADFASMGSEIKNVVDAGADMIHIDVMDGVFVPNLNFGIKMVKDIRKSTSAPFDCHLMIVEPWKYVAKFAEAGADIITVHYEACKERTEETLKEIKKAGVKCGLAVNPDVNFSEVEKYIPTCDLFLVMSVFPGFGGQKFIDGVLTSCERARSIIDESGKDCMLEIDGGINEETAPLAVKAGCDVLVAGSAVFGKRNGLKTEEDRIGAMAKAIAELKGR